MFQTASIGNNASFRKIYTFVMSGVITNKDIYCIGYARQLYAFPGGK